MVLAEFVTGLWIGNFASALTGKASGDCADGRRWK
jgi:hypothetical protein